MSEQEKSCGVILLNEQNEFLIVRHNAGHWDFPKGHVEEGETEEETALREVLEETGLTAVILAGFRETLNYLVRGHIPKEVVFFLGRPVSQDIVLQSEEVSDFAFLPYPEAWQRLTFQSNRMLLEKAQAFLDAHPEQLGR